MEIIIPILIALWIFPTVSQWVIKSTKEKPSARKIYFKIILIPCCLLVFSFWSKISTIFPLIDWVFITIPYLVLSSLLWTTRELKQKTFRIIGIISMVLVFGIGFLISTVGILGLALVLGDYKPTIKKTIGENLVYSETTLGNAISVDRGKRFEIHQKIKWIPILEKKLASKEVYNNLFYSSDTIAVTYDPNMNEVYLNLIRIDEKSGREWKDTLYLK